MITVTKTCDKCGLSQQIDFEIHEWPNSLDNTALVVWKQDVSRVGLWENSKFVLCGGCEAKLREWLKNV